VFISVHLWIKSPSVGSPAHRSASAEGGSRGTQVSGTFLLVVQEFEVLRCDGWEQVKGNLQRRFWIIYKGACDSVIFRNFRLPAIKRRVSCSGWSWLRALHFAARGCGDWSTARWTTLQSRESACRALRGSPSSPSARVRPRASGKSSAEVFRAWPRLSLRGLQERLDAFRFLALQLQSWSRCSAFVLDHRRDHAGDVLNRSRSSEQILNGIDRQITHDGPEDFDWTGGILRQRVGLPLAVAEIPRRRKANISGAASVRTSAPLHWQALRQQGSCGLPANLFHRSRQREV